MASTDRIVTRFAPSPTGFLHIGSARTALFCWLFARHHGGTFRLRVEDTDRARSTAEATEAIYAGLRWLGLDWDGEAVSQSARIAEHQAAAEAMLAAGTAYRCYASKEDIDAARDAEAAAGRPPRFRSPWRDPNHPAPSDRPSVVRLRAPETGETVVEDLVQGRVAWQNRELDDLILLRSDGTPTYMLAVVVDDHQMGVTDVVRGDDHLTNAARQTLIFQALDWPVPRFAHIPLILGPDGAKLSKRHGALGVEAYRDMGYPAEAMRNYLARLGWSHGDAEFFTTEDAVAWFDLDAVGKSAARFDFQKLENLSGQHIRAMSAAALMDEIVAFFALQQGREMTETERTRLQTALPALQERAKTYVDLLENAHFIFGQRPFVPDEKAAKQLTDVSRGILKKLTERLHHVSWAKEDLEREVAALAEAEGLKLGKVAQPLRAALTGRAVSPSVFDVMLTLGQEETLLRLGDQAN